MKKAKLSIILPELLEELAKQDCINGCFVPIDEIAFEFLIDNNFILDENCLDFTKSLNVKFYGESKADIRSSLIHILANLNKYKFSLIPIIGLINKTIIECEKIDSLLTHYDIGLNDNISFEINEDTIENIVLFSIVLKIGKLKIRLLKCRNEFHKMEKLITLPNGIKCVPRQMLLKELNDQILNKEKLDNIDTVEKHKIRVSILEKSSLDIPMINMPIYQFNKNDQNIINAIENELKKNFDIDNINEYLLLKYLLNDIDESKYIDVKDNITELVKMIRYPKTSLNKDLFLYKICPSNYNKKFIIGDFINFPTFISTTYEPDISKINKYSNDIVFKIVVKPYDYTNLLFIKNGALILYDTIFKIIDRRFVLIDINGIKVQKMMVTLELSKDYNNKEDTDSVILQNIPDLSKYISLPNKNIIYDTTFKNIIDKYSKKGDTSSPIPLKNTTINILSTAIQTIEKEKKDKIEDIARKVKEYEKERSQRNEHRRRNIIKNKEDIENIKRSIREYNENLEPSILKIKKQHEILINKYTIDHQLKNNSLKEILEKLKYDKTEDKIKHDINDSLTSLEMENTQLLDLIKIYEQQDRESIKRSQEFIEKNKQDLNEVNYHKQNIINIEETIEKNNKEINDKILLNNQKITQLKESLVKELEKNKERINNEIQNFENQVKINDEYYKSSVDKVNNKLTNDILSLKNTVKLIIDNYEIEIDRLNKVINNEDLYIESNNKYHEIMMAIAKKYDFSEFDYKLKTYAGILQILNKIDVYDLKNIIKKFDIHGSSDIKKMVMYDFYNDKNILLYAIPYLLKVDNGFKLKNNIGQFTHIDYSIKLLDKENIIKLIHPHVNKIEKLTVEPSKMITTGPTGPTLPMLPIIASGIGLLHFNPVIVFMVMIIIVMILMLFKNLSQKSNYGIPKK